MMMASQGANVAKGNHIGVRLFEAAAREHQQKQTGDDGSRSEPHGGCTGETRKGEVLVQYEYGDQAQHQPDRRIKKTFGGVHDFSSVRYRHTVGHTRFYKA